MTGTVFLAVIGAAALHAAWNAIVKGGKDKTLNMAAIMLGHIPFALPCLLFVPLPAPESLPFISASILLHLGYQLFLLKSYELGDLTQVYPIARGSAPLIVAGVSVMVLGVHLSQIELIGVAIIGAGIISLAYVRQSNGQQNRTAAIVALVTGCFIASYSMVDGYDARSAGTSLGFYSWVALGNGVLFTLYLLIRTPQTLRALPSDGMAVLIFGGGASFAAYAVVTWAFTQAPIALVTALRDTSIIFALLIGVFFLKERVSPHKLASAFMVLVGVVLLRVMRG